MIVPNIPIVHLHWSKWAPAAMFFYCSTVLYCFSSSTSSMKFWKRYNQRVSTNNNNWTGQKWRSRMNESTHVDASIMCRWEAMEISLKDLRPSMCVRESGHPITTDRHTSLHETECPLHIAEALTHSHELTHSISKRIERLAWRACGYNVHIHSLIERNHQQYMLCIHLAVISLRLTEFQCWARKEDKLQYPQMYGRSSVCARICISAAYTALYS